MKKNSFVLLAVALAFQVAINTSSIAGNLGNLDFTFAGGLPAPPSGTLTISSFSSDGTLGVPQLTGDASGSLATSVAINNTPGFNDNYTPFTFGNVLDFTFAFSGNAVDFPDGVSGASTFAFSMLDNNNPPIPY
jgi:hypothetical protein